MFKVPEDSILGTWYNLSFYEGTKCDSKNEVVEPSHKYPMNKLFLIFTWRLSIGPKGENFVLFGFSTSIKGDTFEEKYNFLIFSTGTKAPKKFRAFIPVQKPHI